MYFHTLYRFITIFVSFLEPLLARLSCCFVLFYAVFNSKRNLSAIIAINSLLVGFPLLADIVYPNMFSTASCWPLPHATSIAWRIARSTRLGVVLNFMFIKELNKYQRNIKPLSVYISFIYSFILCLFLNKCNTNKCFSVQIIFYIAYYYFLNLNLIIIVYTTN